MSIFIPYDIESRVEKLKQANLKMLQSEVLDFTNCTFQIDQYFNFKADQVKVKTIKGYVSITAQLGYIPEWLKNVTIEGGLNLSYCKLTSLKNCPQYISDTLYCNYNQISDISEGPKYVGGNFTLAKNKYHFQEFAIRQVCEVKGRVELLHN